MKKVVIAALAGLMMAGSWGAMRAQAAGGVQAAPKPTSLGTVQIPRKVMADGKALAAGSYTLRLTTEMGSPVVGETPESERWVEFVQGSTVKGRELATVLTKADLKEMKKSPAPGVEVLGGDKSDNYLRVWITHAGVSYLVHLVVDK
jgi:hypothetical protein